MTCKYFNENICNENCDSDWIRCYICNQYIEPTYEESEPNGYVIIDAIIDCDHSYELYDCQIEICEKCFQKIKEMRKNE